MNKNNLIVFVTLLILAVASRWFSHLWNFTLIGGVAYFAGSYFKNKGYAVALLFSSLLISDWFIGFHNQMLVVYFAFLAYVLLGSFVNLKSAKLKIYGFCISASLIFYFITNFAVWYEGQLYPQTLSGLFNCYVMAIPFYRNQFLGDLLATGLLFELAPLLLTKLALDNHSETSDNVSLERKNY